MNYYGSIDKENITKIISKVCSVLGNGNNNNAHKLILGTISQETHMGTYKDSSPWKGGRGLCQFDKIAFEDVKARCRKKDRELIEMHFGINIKKINFDMLEYNPLISIIFCRLKYKMIPKEIPTSLIDQAKYWKKYYNTNLGKGEIQNYINNYQRYL